jgi:hypothetical protein
MRVMTCFVSFAGSVGRARCDSLSPMKFVVASVIALSVCLSSCVIETGETESTETKKNYVGAAGVDITEIALFQSLKIPLMKDREQVEADIPIVEGRDAVLRVYYKTSKSYNGKEVRGRLAIRGGGDPIEVKGKLTDESSDEKFSSTFNFVIPGDKISSTFSYSLALLQEGDDSDDNKNARFPSSGTSDVEVLGPKNTFRVIIAPFKYNADDSGRLPDLSEEAVEGYRTRLKQIYPVSDVEVTVRKEIAWNSPLGPDGSGWNGVGQKLFSLRGTDDTPDDVYYYGIFNPRSTFNSYCAQGCLLGVTLLNNQPTDVGSVDLRLALGVGYLPWATDTMAHELGHAHGREHADCGNPGSVDRDYPYPKGTIGAWGLDTKTFKVFGPSDYTDIMGYCDNTWISDYNYKAFFNRAKNVNLPKKYDPSSRRRATLVSIDGYGGGSFGGVSSVSASLGGKMHNTRVRSPGGTWRAAPAHFFPYDHLPGGMLIVMDDDEQISEVDAEIDGRRAVYLR